MKPLTLLTALLAMTPLAAQQPSDDPMMMVRVILFGESIQTRSILLGPGIEDQADRQAGPGIRFMGQFVADSPWVWEVSGRFQSSAHMATDRDIMVPTSPNILDARGVKIYYSYWSVGGGYLLPLGHAVDLGFHLEGRAETINPKGTYTTSLGGPGFVDAHKVYFRPWGRLSLDFKIPTGLFEMVLGAEVAATPIKTDQKAIVPMPELDQNTARAMAPTWSGAVYVGMQF
jgi:hypothetical protein